MKKFLLNTLAFGLTGVIISMSQVEAQQISSQSLFNRCYIQITGKPVPLNHALMKDVISGKTKPIDACKQILKKGQLNAAGSLANINDAESRAVLDQFYSFHRTWFPINNFDTVPGYNSSTHVGNAAIYDATEPALAVTYAMFGPAQKYSSVLTRTTGVTAIRQRDLALEARLGYVQPDASRIYTNSVQMGTAPFTFRDTVSNIVSTNSLTHVSTLLQMPKISTGAIVGIKPTTNTFMVPNISLQTGSAATDKGSDQPALNFSYDFFQTYGGGVLGTPIYLMQYYGHGMNMKFNGQNKVARRWSQQNMETFLCASLPALRESDVRALVDKNSSAAFRQSASCVMCHQTLDPMAYTARNITVVSFDNRRPTSMGVPILNADGTSTSPPPAYINHASAITSYKAIDASVTGWPSAPVNNFHFQTPSGRLTFRSHTGQLIDRPVTGIADLGVKMADTEDYYLCAAKRYFEFMTGIKVPLYDRTDPNNSAINMSLSPEAAQDRIYIETLAKSLRNSGSIIQMVEDIMSSNYYNKENFR